MWRLSRQARFITSSTANSVDEEITHTDLISSSSSSVDRWTQVVDLYVQSVVYHSKYRTIRIQ